MLLAVCTIGLANAALANPPGKSSRWDMQAAAVLAPHAIHAPLDLHLPAPSGEVKQMSASFPSAMHHLQLDAPKDFRLPTLGAEAQQGHIASPMEELARRVHHEGLPVARLWENKSALVSLGLNQRGKPGLWVVQKVH